MHDPTAIRRRLAQHAVSGSWGMLRGLAIGIAFLGVGLLAVALSRGEEGTARAWHLFHVNWLYFTGLSGGLVALAAVHKVAHARWSGLLIRFAQAGVAFFPISFVGFLLIFTLGYDHIFPVFHGLGHGKELWLSYPWMFTRLFIGLGGLFVLGWRFVRLDMVPDAHEVGPVATGARQAAAQKLSLDYDGSAESLARVEDRVGRMAAGYIVVYALVFTLVAFDLIMALQPHWFSNLLGGFYFMGSFLGAHMALVWLMFIGGAVTGIGALISGHQRHDLGKLCFGFTVFWAYLMWSQFLVIWYGNLPEETGFVFARLWGPWRPIGTAVFAGLFIIPFAGLLGVAPKKYPVTLGLLALISLDALWLERYLMVMPSVTASHGPLFGAPEIGATALLLGLFLLSYTLFAGRFPMVSPRQGLVTIERELHHAELPSVGETDEAADYDTEALIERDVESGENS